MLFGFPTEDMSAAKSAMLIYAIYRSRNKQRGPSGTDMWGQIERFARSSAKRARDVGEFTGTFKRRMACDTISPKWMNTGVLRPNEFGEIVVIGGERHFMPEIMECPEAEQRQMVDMIYRQTTRIVLLVRARLEEEKPLEAAIRTEADDEHRADISD